MEGEGEKMAAKNEKLEVIENGIGGLKEERVEKQVMRGADMVVRALEDEGVEVVFGFPGGQVLPLYDALYDSKK